MKIALVILNWNNLAKTTRCLNALSKYKGHPISIVVVDNGSTDGSGDQVKLGYPEFHHLQNKTNLGFAGGVNVGLRYAYDMQFDLFVLLNSDMIVSSVFLDPAIRALELADDVGMVTGKILKFEPPGQIWHAGGQINSLTVKATSRGLGEQDEGQYDFDCDTKWASGAMCVITRRLIDKIGLLPDNYFFGQEEWDYSTSTLKSGYRILYSHRFTGVHEAGSNHKDGHPVLKVYGTIRNRFIYANRHLPKWKQLWFSWSYLIYLLTLWPIKARYKCKSFRDFRARYFAAWLAYIEHFKSSRVDLGVLERAQHRIGNSDSWDESWTAVRDQQ